VLSRAIAERGRYPAIDILKSVSRSMPRCNSEDEIQLLRRARALISAYADMADMIRLGAYKPGSDPLVDEAIRQHEPLEAFLDQRKSEAASLAEGYRQLAEILGPDA